VFDAANTCLPSARRIPGVQGVAKFGEKFGEMGEHLRAQMSQPVPSTDGAGT